MSLSSNPTITCWDQTPSSGHCQRDATAADGLARDQHGNALGGFRLPWMEVPDAQYTGIIHDKNPLEGGMRPFDETKMAQLYGSEEAYRQRLQAYLQQMVRDRWIEERDITLMHMRGDTEALYLGFNEGVAT